MGGVGGGEARCFIGVGWLGVGGEVFFGDAVDGGLVLIVGGVGVGKGLMVVVYEGGEASGAGEF